MKLIMNPSDPSTPLYCYFRSTLDLRPCIATLDLRPCIATLDLYMKKVKHYTLKFIQMFDFLFTGSPRSVCK